MPFLELVTLKTRIKSIVCGKITQKGYSRSKDVIADILRYGAILKI